MTALSLDGAWEFIPDPGGAYRVETLPPGVPIVVPGSWEAQRPERTGIVRAWYRRRVAVPASWADDTIVLRFGAVMHRAEVWLDGTRIGEHEGGFTPFVFDVTKLARPGSEYDLVVRVVNPLNALREYPALPTDPVLSAGMGGTPMSEVPHGKQTWYSSLSGIWQSVELEGLPDAALEALRVVPDLDEQALAVHWKLRRPCPGATLDLRVIDPAGDEAARRTIAIQNARQHGREQIFIRPVQPWGVGSPNLYRLEAQVTGPSGSKHERSVRLGFRRIETRGGRLLLNGAPLLLRGALDQDCYPEGLSPTGDRRAFYGEQFMLAREMGLNLIRCHLKVPDPAYLDAADEAGVLLWCELPNWSQFTSRAAALGRATLKTMVETMGHHPSVVIWTIINEDWGIRMNDEPRDRSWLLQTYDWLKALDPTRLVVDNSSCESAENPNFHLATDIADFHQYFSMPDQAIGWRNLVADFARRPAWLWSPHADARPRGDEPLVMSEFGNWGLPDISGLEIDKGVTPWWLGTGREFTQPAGALERFRDFALDRIWSGWTEMAAATQARQFEALQYQVGELRRHSELSGYVITEFTDAYWEANGLLDLGRRRKTFHDRLREINGPEMLIADLGRRDVWGGDRLGADLAISSFAGPSERPASLAWALRLDGEVAASGRQPVETWPVDGAAPAGRLEINLPVVERAAQAELEIRALAVSGRVRTRGAWSLAILPARRRKTAAPLRIAVEDPLGICGLKHRLRKLGHEFASLDDADLLVTTELTIAGRNHADSGGRVLVLVRSRSAIAAEVELERPIVIHPRRLADRATGALNPSGGDTDAPSPWGGDWVSAYSWLDISRHPDLPAINPLDWAYQEVIPDHVLGGYEPRPHAAEVSAGMFVGWVHAPAALLWTFRQGRGSITVTTFKLAPEDGPVATVLLEDLIQGRLAPIHGGEIFRSGRLLQTEGR